MLGDAALAPVGPVTDLSTAITAATNVVAQAADRTAAKRATDKAQQDAAKAQRDADAAQAKLLSGAKTAGDIPAWFWGALGVGSLGLVVLYLTTHRKRHR